MYGFWFGEIPTLHQAGSTHGHRIPDFCRAPGDGGQVTRSEGRTGILSFNISSIGAMQIYISLLRGEALTARRSVRWRGTAGKAAILRPHLAFPPTGAGMRLAAMVRDLCGSEQQQLGGAWRPPPAFRSRPGLGHFSSISLSLSTLGFF